MTKNMHINTLKFRHQEIDAQIKSETQKACPDSLLVRALKQKKLYLKDRMKSL